jgi:integrase
MSRPMRFKFSTHNWRRVPTPPPQARLLRAHLRDFPAAPGGRIFARVQGGELASITYRRPWAKARHDTLSAAEAASPLAGRVYDLRHACVSMWLNGGIPPAQVAERAGHSVAILLKIYAKCLDGQDDIAKRRIEEALGDPGDGAESPGAGGSAEDFGTCQVRHIKFGVKFGVKFGTYSVQTA